MTRTVAEHRIRTLLGKGSVTPLALAAVLDEFGLKPVKGWFMISKDQVVKELVEQLLKKQMDEPKKKEGRKT